MAIDSTPVADELPGVTAELPGEPDKLSAAARRARTILDRRGIAGLIEVAFRCGVRAERLQRQSEPILLSALTVVGREVEARSFSSGVAAGVELGCRLRGEA